MALLPKKIRFVLAAKTPLKTNRFIRYSSLLRGRSRAVDKLRPFGKVCMAIFFERIVGWRCDLSSACDVSCHFPVLQKRMRNRLKQNALPDRY